MPKMHIEKSTAIDAPVNKVYATLNDLNKWQAWSPWLIMEPEATVDVSEDGKSYSWEGDLVGSGEMKITSEDENQRIDLDLTFLKPWKSKAKVWFEMSEEGDSTKLTWLMDSGLPFFLFWMKKMMTAFVGMDYERGLSMLKDYIETGEVPSKLDNEGLSSYSGCKYMGIKTECTIDKIGPSMQEDFGKLRGWAKENEENIADIPFSIYHKWDMVKGKVIYTSGIPIKEVPEETPEGFTTGEIPAISTYNVTHTGPFRHLGNAWSLGMTLARNKVYKSSKKVHPFETYLTEPGKVSENETVTRIHFPVK